MAQVRVEREDWAEVHQKEERERTRQTKERVGREGEQRKGWIRKGREMKGRGGMVARATTNNQANQMQWNGEAIGQGQRRKIK